VHERLAELMTSPRETLQALLLLSNTERLEPLTQLGQSLIADNEPELRTAVADALAALIESGEGPLASRLQLGEVLGRLGDPRLRTPQSSDYWVDLGLDDHTLKVGRFPVTTQEFAAWLEDGGLQDDSVWSEAGLAWRDTRRTLWTDLAADPDAAHLVVPNQPAIGVTWYEAEAYAKAHGARLLTLDERMQIMRGDGNRPYPWGQPFGQRNANTREEAVGKPSAVGLFQQDQTPEGICDLAGNVAEWTSDHADDERVIHPGSWNAPSMSAWAKARALVPPKTRSADLGFRIARDS
jgi:hypothetical protein